MRNSSTFKNNVMVFERCFSQLIEPQSIKLAVLVGPDAGGFCLQLNTVCGLACALRQIEHICFARRELISEAQFGCWLALSKECAFSL